MPSLSTAIYKLIGTGVLVVSLLGGLWFYIHGLKSTINEQSITIDSLNKDQKNCKLQLALKESNIQTLETSLDKLTNKVTVLNKKYQDSVDKYNKWKQQPPKIKYKYIYKYIKSDNKKLKNGDCKEAKKLVKSIAGIKYDDL